MVKRGDIIKLSFSPQKGHEQAGFRPAVVISNDQFSRVCTVTLICPITNSDKYHPLHVKLDNRTNTTGAVMCEQIRAMDLRDRKYQFVERMPEDLLWDVSDLVRGSVE
jgi:mRNA interferase MazF